MGVVPEAMSAWNPEIAPQAMVMKANGNTLPAKIGPVPSRLSLDWRFRVAGEAEPADGPALTLSAGF